MTTAEKIVTLRRIADEVGVELELFAAPGMYGVKCFAFRETDPQRADDAVRAAVKGGILPPRATPDGWWIIHYWPEIRPVVVNVENQKLFYEAGE